MQRETEMKMWRQGVGGRVGITPPCVHLLIML